MQSLNRFNRLLSTTMLTSALLAISPAFAQDVEQVPDAAQEAEDSGDQVVVTGSRLRKDSFNSASPLTSLDVDSSAKIGVTSITELLARSTVANGTQIDQTLNTSSGNSNATEAPPTGGTGSSNISLRGLGPERTLVLLNGRRLAATGVRGAPSQPDISLIPFTIVDRAEIVTEAGSSIYGADAVAGTVNVILREDFEGLELNATYERPGQDGGTQFRTGLIAGAQGERARITFAAEYADRQRVTAGERDFSAIARDININQDGSITSIVQNGFFDNIIVAAPANGGINPNTGGPYGNVFFAYTPGSTNIGVPNFSNIPALGAILPPGVRNFNIPVDANNDGTISQTEINTANNSATNFTLLPFYSDQAARSRSDLVGDLERFSIVTTGEVDLDWFGTNNQFYFESFYFDRTTRAIGINEQIFPDIPALINELDEDGNVVGQVDNPLNPFDDTDVAPILTLDSVPQIRDVELQQFRFVAGMRGEFGGGWFQAKDWNWDVFFSYDRGTGFVAQPILFEPNLILSTLNVVQLADGTLSCGIPNNTAGFGSFVTPNACVPLNLFDEESFTGGPNGDGALSPEEEAFLIGNRTNRTVIEQYVVSGFLDGDLFSIAGGGDVKAGVGFEYRRDNIESQNDITGVQGLNAAENPLIEGETFGSRDFIEFFGEVSIPLIQDQPWAELLLIEGAVRYTNESNFGSDVTYKGSLQYRPVSWASLSGGYGTSFRAPNLREQFLADQGGGVSGALDPCIAVNLANSLTVAGNDADQAFVNLVNNCIASGVQITDSDSNGFPDTTVLGTQGVTTIPTTSGGNSELEPETSRTFTITGSVSQPWFEGFTFDLAVSYYDISINNTVSELPADSIIGRCFNDQDFPNLTSPFCSLITRPNSGNPASNIINGVDVSFFNIGNVTSRGIDINSRFGTDLPLKFNGEPVAWASSVAVSYLLEQDIEIFGPMPVDPLDPSQGTTTDRDDNAGEIGFATTRINIGNSFTWGNWSLTSEHRRIGGQQQDDTDPDLPNAFLPSFPNSPIGHDVDFVEAVWYHDASLTYSQDAYSLSVGVNNIANREPPLIDAGEGPERNNAVTSSGYDFFGRSYFITARVAF
jgi:iron complex outermembrane receptor protein